MSIGVSLLLACLAGFAYFSRRFMGDLFLERPIVLAPLTGLIMGDFHTGLIIGGSLELIFMGASNIGGSVPPNYTIGSVLGTALAISSGQGIETALLIAVPAALLGVFCEVIAKTVCVFFVNAADRMAANGNDKGISRMVHLGNIVHFLADAIPTFIALQLGAEAVSLITNDIPTWLKSGMAVAGNILPALGFALLLTTLASPSLFPFLFIGFIIAAYLKVGVLGVALLAIMCAIIMQARKNNQDEYEDMNEGEESTSLATSVLSKKDMRQLYFRSFSMQSAFSFDRMQALGFTWAMIPILRKLYKDKSEEFKEALKRHIIFFNTHPWLPGPILALTTELEIKKSRGEDIDTKAIQGLKSGLMGPIAGVGDSMFHATLRPLVGGIAASLALQGNPIAPLLFFVVVNAVHLYVRWYTMKKGFELGDRIFGVMSSGGIRKIMEGATMTGLMALGALIATWLNVTTPLKYTVQEASVSIQSMLDGIMPKLLPLALTLLVFWLIRKRVKTTTIMLGLIVAGLVLGGFKILG
ncbi:PTS system mannose/fructose/sorbose family transporter subunit IID [Paenibacillus solisilvae]|uniref:PTS system mannose/fructose/sorbose family transporter subunit IID n=1 Tax=Paenibacillus solisilvae TaxID=2486751 RepID=A0ABW0W317_9BACL